MDSCSGQRNLPKILNDKFMKREKNQREKIWEEASGHCIYCGHPVSLENMEIDHIDPLCLGGDNRFENKVCSCPRCNAEKGGKTLEEFLEQTMNAGKRKRFSNRVNHLAIQNKISWAKAFRLDPYTCDAFDEDFDYDYLEDYEEDGFEGYGKNDNDGFHPVKSLRFNGEFTIEFR